MAETTVAVNVPVKPMRWFVAIKRNDASLLFTSKQVSMAPTQEILLREVLEVASNDTVLELFQSNTLEPMDFTRYCRDAYAGLLPKRNLAAKEEKAKPGVKPVVAERN